MAYAVVLSAIPDRIIAGESVSWKYSNSNYPASDSWELVYSLVNSSGQIQISSSADGEDHLIEIPMATSAAYSAGTYDWQAHISNGTERYKVAEGVIEIVADFAEQDSGYDARSHVKKVLDALEAAIEGRASKTQQYQTVGGVQIQHMTLKDQVALRDAYYSKYQRELVRAGKAQSRRRIKARFV